MTRSYCMWVCAAWEMRNPVFTALLLAWRYWNDVIFICMVSLYNLLYNIYLCTYVRVCYTLLLSLLGLMTYTVLSVLITLTQRRAICLRCDITILYSPVFDSSRFLYFSLFYLSSRIVLFLPFFLILFIFSFSV